MTWKIFIVFFSTIFWMPASGQGVDLTIVSGAKSEAVVDATIQRLTMIPNLFSNDYGILKRIALVESNYGENTQGVPGGGIWQITSRIYNELKTNSRARSIVSSLNSTQELKALFDLDSTKDFSVPMRSAFIGRLYIEVTTGGAALTILEEQADYWSGTYKPNERAELFIQIVEQNQDASPCVIEKLDLYFLADGSGSVNSNDFLTTQHFINATSHQFTISPDKIWAALTVFSSSPVLVSGFNEDTSNSEFESAIYGVTQPARGTGTSIALVHVHNTFQIQGRPRSEGVPRILVVLTDGASNSGVQPGANTVKAAGVIVYAVGVGSGFDEEEINEISSGPQYAFAISDFNNLVATLTSTLRTEACRAPVVVENTMTVSVDIQPKAPRYAELALQNGGSVTVFFGNPNPNADITIFISTSVPNPSGVLYDISVTLGQGNWEIAINDLGNGKVNYGLSIRNRRQTESGSMPLYVALQSDSTEPTSINLRSVSSDLPADLPNMQVSGRLCYSLNRSG